MSETRRSIKLQPRDLAELLQLKEEREVDAAFKAASTFSSLVNYLREGDSLSIAGLTFLKTSESSLEILNTIDDQCLIELISEDY